MDSNELKKDYNTRPTIDIDNFSKSQKSQKVSIKTREDVESSIDIADWIRKGTKERVPLNFMDSEEIGIFGNKEFSEDWINSLLRKAFLGENKTDGMLFDLFYFKDNGALMYVLVDPYKIDSVVGDDDDQIDRLNPVELMHKVSTKLIEEVGFHEVFSGGKHSDKIKDYLKLYKQIENARKNVDIFE